MITPSCAPAIRFEGFDGPLELLLMIVERRELDITTVSLARVADDYLAQLRAMPGLDPDALSGFIAIGARLLLIKSAALLPRTGRPIDDVEPFEDPEDLARRLREYQAFRAAATTLREREESGLRSYLPLAPVRPTRDVPRDRRGEPTDLRRAIERIVAVALREAAPEPVAREAFTIADKMTELRDSIRVGAVSLAALLRGRHRGEVVATFLALLELQRLGEVAVEQAELFGDITVAAVA